MGANRRALTAEKIVNAIIVRKLLHEVDRGFEIITIMANISFQANPKGRRLSFQLIGPWEIG